MCAARDLRPLSFPEGGVDPVSNRKTAHPEKVTAFLERTDPLAVQAMRKCFGGQWGDPSLTVEEQAALDSFLEPRLAGLVEELAARIVVRPAPLGPVKYQRRRRA